MTKTQKAFAHWLYQAAGTTGKRFLAELGRIGSPEIIYMLLEKGELKERLSERYQKKIARMEAFSEGYDVIKEYEKMCGRGITAVFYGEKEYPKKLAEISDPPYVLYCAGRLPEKERRTVAVVGARECSEYGRCMAKRFGRELAEAGVQVVSGMARGIDGISQSAAVEAGGYSLGVLGCGVDICYPNENRRLYDALLANGGVVSEYPPKTEPKAAHFPPRNRIISGLADAVLVIEAREKSGTLITVDMALEQGREVYVLPGRVTDELSKGCNRLIKQGAGVVTCIEDLLGELAVKCEWTANGQRQERFAEGRQKELWELLDFAPQPAEKIRNRYQEKYGEEMTLPELFCALLQLCADGWAKQSGGTYFYKSGE